MCVVDHPGSITEMADQLRRIAARAERDRIRLLGDLRPPPHSEADRDHGLEHAWARHLSGRRITGPALTVELDAGGRYRLQHAATVGESGEWTVWSNVGRACLMLHPGGGERYGFVLSRDARGGLRLNGAPYSFAAP